MTNKKPGRPPKQKVEVQEAPQQEEVMPPNDQNDNPNPSEKENTETAKRPSSSATHQNSTKISNEPEKTNPPVIMMKMRITEETKNFIKDAEVGEESTVVAEPITALKVMAKRLERAERALELLYHVKLTEITTPESQKHSSELDRIFKHYSL